MDVVRVAPREISDVVSRCCRVRGIDPGVAQQIGTDVMMAHIGDGTTVSTFAEAARSTDLTTFSVPADSFPASTETIEAAYRNGVEVNAASWHELYEMSASFLVSAELLDSFATDDD